MKEERFEGRMPPGLAVRVAVSIVVVFAWLILIILHMVFFAQNYSLLENIAIILVVTLAGMAILGAMWAAWGIMHGRKTAEISKKASGKPERKRKK